MSEIETGDGWAVGHNDDMGEGPGFRKVRRALEVSEMGINVIVMPPRYESGFHYHQQQEEVYFLHSGSAEMVFGVAGSQGGLGWFIYQNRFEMNTDLVFAGLLTVILIGLLVENLFFRWLERRTVLRWGMSAGH